MTVPGEELVSLTKAVDEALELLGDYAHPHGYVQGGVSLPSLLTQFETVLAEADAMPVGTVRTLHHFACTGGTLISRCLAAMPNTVLLSEIDPLSSYYKKVSKKQFTPTDMTLHLRNNLRPARDEVITEMFIASVSSLYASLSAEGRRLVLRDHAHSQFCSQIDPNTRPTLKALLETHLPVRSCVTVRHPLDSYLSLNANNWRHFQPFTLEEYSRRYLLFLNDYAATEVVRYEDVVAAPENALRHMCAILDLPFVAEALDILEVVELSGDSGRRGDVIGPRPRREVPEAIADEARNSPTYEKLCARLGYRSDPATT